MSSLYPGGIDDFQADTIDPSSQHAPVSHLAWTKKASDALEKMQAELGADPSGGYSNVAARLDASALPAVLDLNYGFSKIKTDVSAGTNTLTLIGAPGILGSTAWSAVLIGAGRTNAEFFVVSSAVPSGSDTAVTLAHNLTLDHVAGEQVYVWPYAAPKMLIPGQLAGMSPGATNGEATSNVTIFNRFMGDNSQLLAAGSWGLLLDNLYRVNATCDWESGLLLYGNGWLKGPGLKALNFTFAPLVVGTLASAVLRGQRNGVKTRFNDGPQGYYCGGGFSISANNASDGNLIGVVTNQPHYLENVYLRDAPGLAVAGGGSDGGRYQNLNFDNVGQCWNVDGSKAIWFTDCVAATQANGNFPWFSARASIGCGFRGLYPEVPYGAGASVVDFSGATSFLLESFYTSGPQNPFTGSHAVLHADTTVPNPGPTGAQYAIRAAWCGDPTVAAFWRDEARSIVVPATDASQGRVLMDIVAQGNYARWTTVDGAIEKWINGSDYMISGLKTNGSPNSVVSAAGKGSTCTDISTGDQYTKTTPAGTATGWVKMN